MKKYIILLYILFILLLNECAESSFNNSKDRSVKRIVSVSPEVTEILFALGCENSLVGVSSFCNYPDEVKKIEKVGTFSHPSLEKIVFLKPDIIFSAGIEQAPVILKLEKLGIPVFTYSPKSIDEIFQKILIIGKTVNRKEEALDLVENIRKEIIFDKSPIPNSNKRPKIYLEISEKPYMSVCKGSFIHELIELSGGKNAAEKGIRPFTQVSAETLINWNPDIIIMTHSGSKESLMKRSGWNQINAVKNSFVFDDIDPDVLLRAGPRIVDGYRQIRNIVDLYEKYIAENK